MEKALLHTIIGALDLILVGFARRLAATTDVLVANVGGRLDSHCNVVVHCGMRGQHLAKLGPDDLDPHTFDDFWLRK